MSSRIWCLRREGKQFRRVCRAAVTGDHEAFWAAFRRLKNAQISYQKAIEQQRHLRYTARRLDVSLIA